MLSGELLKQVCRGKSLMRALLNLHLKKFTVHGLVLDIGGGAGSSYFRFLNKMEDAKIINLDLDIKADQRLDLERDALPFADCSVDQALAFNILEHIYNHNFLLAEISRVLKPTGQLIGFVPFIINYHPDPHDYFRYSHEALEKMLQQAKFSQIKITALGFGPWSANYNNIMILLPRILRVVLFYPYYLLDKLFLKIKPKMRQRYPLGFFFIAQKND
ncbi:MAG: methyltransferase domain-containing protein [Patescibacteria group bacterium]